MNKIILCVPYSVLLFFLIDKGHCIKCFTCTARRNSTDFCVKNVSVETPVIDCDGGESSNSTSCMTIIKNDTIIRQCEKKYEGCPESVCVSCFKNFCNTDYVLKTDPSGMMYITQGPLIELKTGTGKINEARIFPIFICICLCMLISNFYKK